ncbi:glycosyltransferase family 2 protein [Piscibacillus salipiscarius]|uniref:glycosyltransferase family 2 protein n=1 Tax=Piscibacillus salipiscarius TaxID=299480 RepID=UPI0006D2A132|nr:glycosyltransferase family A protein [Piscibacillus salipiscarius]
MKVSVIIPVYNTVEYLEDCLESVINQTYKDLEIIVVNDASTDNSGLVIDELMKADNRIKKYDLTERKRRRFCQK